MKRSHTSLYAAAVMLFAPTLYAAEPEILLGTPGPAGAYLQTLHTRGSQRWEGNFLATATAKLPKDHPLNNPSLRVVLDVVVIKTGKLGGVTVKESSGLPDFDTAAVEVAKDSLPLAAAPDESLSDDNKVHFTWAFARDDRRCDELKLIHAESPLEEAIPRLLSYGREGEALKRVRGARAPETAMSLFATAWLRRAVEQGEVAPAAAAALIAAGERADEALVRKAVQQGDQSAALPAAIARAKLQVCGQLGDRLASKGSPEQAAAVSLLRLSGEAACAPALINIVQTPSLPLPLRLAAVEALGAGPDPAGKKVIRDLAANGTPAALKAAAIIASAPPGGGNATLFRLAPMLHDPSLDIRVAVISGLLRGVGEPSVAQFYLLFNEKDARPYEAAAAGLAHLSSEASATLLARMLKKDDARIRQAGAAALAHRTDAFARKALENVRNDAAPEVRVFAASLLDEGQRRDLVAALPATDMPRLYRALVNGSARTAAADWLLTALPKAPPPAKIDLLGTWIAASPAAPSVAITREPAEPGAR
jgi:TonB family protein